MATVSVAAGAGAGAAACDGGSLRSRIALPISDAFDVGRRSLLHAEELAAAEPRHLLRLRHIDRGRIERQHAAVRERDRSPCRSRSSTSRAPRSGVPSFITTQYDAAKSCVAARTRERGEDQRFLHQSLPEWRLRTLDYTDPMLVVMEAGARPDQIEAVVRHIERMGLKAHAIPGANRTAIGITGKPGTADPEVLENYPGVKEVIRVSHAYKLVSREAQAGRQHH